jgi:ABC-type amino acid transport substrate-binding protein
MKKNIVKVASLALATIGAVSFASCSTNKLLVGKEYVVAETQLSALMNLDNGTADVAVIDSVMAGYYTSTGDYANKMQIVDGLVFAEEQYGIAAKKGNDALISKVNDALIAIRESAYASIIEEYNLASSIALTAETTNPNAEATDNSWNNLVEDGTLVIGYTVFAPIAYEENGALTGFDIELANAVVDYWNDTYNTNITIEFQIINWSAKETLLENGSIDLVWNGMTITPDRAEQMCVSVPYLLNKQVAVVLKEDASKYNSNKMSMAQAIMTAEAGSAGETVIIGEQDAE